jgi:hypothetical protein
MIVEADSMEAIVERFFAIAALALFLESVVIARTRSIAVRRCSFLFKMESRNRSRQERLMEVILNHEQNLECAAAQLLREVQQVAGDL